MRAAIGDLHLKILVAWLALPLIVLKKLTRIKHADQECMNEVSLFCSDYYNIY